MHENIYRIETKNSMALLLEIMLCIAEACVKIFIIYKVRRDLVHQSDENVNSVKKMSSFTVLELLHLG